MYFIADAMATTACYSLKWIDFEIAGLPYTMVA